MRAHLAIARQAFLESLREPAFVAVLWGTIFLLALSTRLPLFGFREDTFLLREIGLSTLYLAGTVLAALAASSSLSAEIERGTALAILSKPVGRAGFVIAKYAGTLAAAGAGLWILGVAYLIATRAVLSFGRYDTPALIGIAVATVASLAAGAGANYFFGRPFATSAALCAGAALPAAYAILAFVTPRWGLTATPLLPPGIALRGIVLVGLAVAILAALAVALSARASGGTALAGTLLAFGLGLAGDAVIPDHPSGALALVRDIIPDLRIFWAGDLFYTDGASVPGTYIASAALYAALLVAALLAIAIARIRGRDVGGAF
ncbi:MAG: hypothetical protein JXP34_19465 [Planctomycetes bacterium]|nr:hypothetical protein [Planctomycetota bacterium]